MSFASRLRQAREQAGFTQQDLAKKLGVTKNAISNYENGVSSPKWEILVEIFDILHVDPNFLYQDDFSSELAEAHVLTPQQSTLLAAFDQLNDEGQTKAVEYVEDLVLTGRYKKCPASGLKNNRSGYTKAADQYMEKSSCFRPMTTQMPAKSPMLCKSYPPKINPPTKSLFSG